MQRRRHLVVYVPSVFPNIISFALRGSSQTLSRAFAPHRHKNARERAQHTLECLALFIDDSFSRCKGRVELEMNLRTLFFFRSASFIMPLYVQFCVDAALTRHEIHTGLPAP